MNSLCSFFLTSLCSVRGAVICKYLHELQKQKQINGFASLINLYARFARSGCISQHLKIFFLSTNYFKKRFFREGTKRTFFVSLVDTRLKLSGLSKKNKGVKLLYERTFRNHNRRYWGIKV